MTPNRRRTSADFYRSHGNGDLLMTRGHCLDEPSFVVYIGIAIHYLR
jgi:hypothetical protein